MEHHRSVLLPKLPSPNYVPGTTSHGGIQDGPWSPGPRHWARLELRMAWAHTPALHPLVTSNKVQISLNWIVFVLVSYQQLGSILLKFCRSEVQKLFHWAKTKELAGLRFFWKLWGKTFPNLFKLVGAAWIPWLMAPSSILTASSVTRSKLTFFLISASIVGDSDPPTSLSLKNFSCGQLHLRKLTTLTNSKYMVQ